MGIIVVSNQSKVSYILLLLVNVLLFGACQQNHKGMEGKWEYQGGIYNGKKEGAPEDYQLQRTYKASTYEGFVIEKDVDPEKYDGGNYELKDSVYIETATFSSQPSQIINKTITYQYKREGDLFTIIGTLPSGMTIEEYWRKVK